MSLSKDQKINTRLIELFREKRVLWDSTLPDFKNRQMKHKAWSRLGKELGTDANIVEKKMRSLIGQFQRELKRGKNGDGADAPYKTNWFFFKMLLFLKDRNAQRYSTEGGLPAPDQKAIPIFYIQSQDRQEDEKIQLHPEVQRDAGTSQEKTVHTQSARTSTAKISHRKFDSNFGEALIDQQPSKIEKRDEFDVYGEYVAHTLRNLKTKSVRTHTKYEINNILYRSEVADASADSSPEPRPEHFTSSATPTPSISLICKEEPDGVFDFT